jgi:hypothetical protein
VTLILHPGLQLLKIYYTGTTSPRKGVAMHKSAQNKGKQDPDLAKCQTGRVGSVLPGTTREMYYCRIDNEDCRFAMPFGFDYICKHLNNHEFLTSDDEDHGKVIAMFIADSTGKLWKRQD